jgi:hypothetical protein
MAPPAGPFRRDIGVVNKTGRVATTKPRRRVALIGVVAMLLQAVLFGWHHHGAAVRAVSGPIASLHNTTQPLAPAAAEELCEICAALHQQSAAPLAFTMPPRPVATIVAIDRPDAAPIGWADARGFDARAPPLA